MVGLGRQTAVSLFGCRRYHHHRRTQCCIAADHRRQRRWAAGRQHFYSAAATGIRSNIDIHSRDLHTPRPEPLLSVGGDVRLHRPESNCAVLSAGQVATSRAKPVVRLHAALDQSDYLNIFADAVEQNGLGFGVVVIAVPEHIIGDQALT